nr:interleukin-27 subunit alpha-like [Pan troglodytes]
MWHALRNAEQHSTTLFWVRGLSLLLLPLLLVQAGVWGFPRPPGRPQLSLQELRREFTVSLHLARKLLSKVRGQAHRFAESHLPGVNLYLLPLGEQLPDVSLTFQAWRRLSDPERLCFISTTLQPFHALLGGLGTQGRWTNMERMQLWAMRLDLRDLQRHLRFRVEPGHPPPPQTTWERRLAGSFSDPML